MNSLSPLFVGLTRFSLFIPNAREWNLSAASESTAEYMERLYSPERLDTRLRIFSEISVPQLAAASKGFQVVHIVQHSSSLPEVYKEALRNLADEHNFLRVVCSDSVAEHARVVEDTFRSEILESDWEDARLAWYRLDDDDILSDQFFAKAEPYITSENSGRVLSFGLGYSVIYHDGQMWDVREDYRPKNSIGQMYICGFDGASLIEPPRRNHAQIDRWAPTILDSREHSFVTVVHPEQDGRSVQQVDSVFGMLDREQEAKPFVDASALLEKFPVVVHRAISRSSTKVNAGGEKLSTTPAAFPIADVVGDVSVGFHVEASEVDPHSRVIFALRFAPGSRPERAGRWVEIGSDTLAIGYNFVNRRVVGRALTLRYDNSAELIEVSAWVSRDFGGDASLINLTVETASR